MLKSSKERGSKMNDVRYFVSNKHAESDHLADAEIYAVIDGDIYYVQSLIKRPHIGEAVYVLDSDKNNAINRPFVVGEKLTVIFQGFDSEFVAVSEDHYISTEYKTDREIPDDARDGEWILFKDVEIGRFFWDNYSQSYRQKISERYTFHECQDPFDVLDIGNRAEIVLTVNGMVMKKEVLTFDEFKPINYSLGSSLIYLKSLGDGRFTQPSAIDCFLDKDYCFVLKES